MSPFFHLWVIFEEVYNFPNECFETKIVFIMFGNNLVDLFALLFH
jgi:hypothetical protein